MPRRKLIYEPHLLAATPSNNAIKSMHFHAYRKLRNAWRVSMLAAIGSKAPAAPIARSAREIALWLQARETQTARGWLRMIEPSSCPGGRVCSNGRQKGTRVTQSKAFTPSINWPAMEMAMAPGVYSQALKRGSCSQL